MKKPFRNETQQTQLEDFRNRAFKCKYCRIITFMKETNLIVNHYSFIDDLSYRFYVEYRCPCCGKKNHIASDIVPDFIKLQYLPSSSHFTIK